jgi:peroxiredoxin
MRVLLLGLLACFCTWAANELSNRRAPGFSLPDAQLKRHDLQDYRGKIVLIDFIRTNCPSCAELSRTLERVKARYRDQVVILSVVVYPPENQDTVAKYVKTNGVTSPVLFDCSQMAASYLNIGPGKPQFEVPHLFVIDGGGTIRHDFAHAHGDDPIFQGDALFPVLDKLLAGRK